MQHIKFIHFGNVFTSRVKPGSVMYVILFDQNQSFFRILFLLKRQEKLYSRLSPIKESQGTNFTYKNALLKQSTKYMRF